MNNTKEKIMMALVVIVFLFVCAGLGALAGMLTEYLKVEK